MQISLTLFADGVNIRKSTHRRELWPVWLQISDLPPKLRMERKNFVLGALFVGFGAPDLNEIVPSLRAEMLTPIELESDQTSSLNVVFKVRLLVSDLCAKSHMLNMFKFNGFYGCNYCTAEGKTIGKTHAYYPFNQIGKVREPRINNAYVNMAESFGPSIIPNVVGVKGKSAFSIIVDELPLTAPIDYTHCVLLGVFLEVVKLCYRSMSPDERDLLNQIV